MKPIKVTVPTHNRVGTAEIGQRGLRGQGVVYKGHSTRSGGSFAHAHKKIDLAHTWVSQRYVTYADIPSPCRCGSFTSILKSETWEQRWQWLNKGSKYSLCGQYHIISACSGRTKGMTTHPATHPKCFGLCKINAPKTVTNVDVPAISGDVWPENLFSVPINHILVEHTICVL